MPTKPIYRPHLFLLVSPPGGGKTDILNQLVLSGMKPEDLLLDPADRQRRQDVSFDLQIIPWLTQRPRRKSEKGILPDRTIALEDLVLDQIGDKIFLPYDDPVDNEGLMESLESDNLVYAKLSRKTAAARGRDRLIPIEYALLRQSMDAFDRPSYEVQKIGLLSLPPLKLASFAATLEEKLQHAIIHTVFQYTDYKHIQKRLTARAKSDEERLDMNYLTLIRHELHQEYEAFLKLIRDDALLYINNDPPMDSENLTYEENLRIVRDMKKGSFRRLKHIISSTVTSSWINGDKEPVSPLSLRKFEIDRLISLLFGKPLDDLVNGDRLVVHDEGLGLLSRIYFGRDAENLREEDLYMKLVNWRPANPLSKVHLELRRKHSSDDDALRRAETYFCNLLPAYADYRDGHDVSLLKHQFPEQLTLVIPGTTGRVKKGTCWTSELAINIGLREDTTDAFFADYPLSPSQLADPNYNRRMLRVLAEKKILPFYLNRDILPLAKVPWAVEPDQQGNYRTVSTKSDLSVLFPYFMKSLHALRIFSDNIPEQFRLRIGHAWNSLKDRADTDAPIVSSQLGGMVQQPLDVIDSRMLAGVLEIQCLAGNGPPLDMIDYFLSSRVSSTEHGPRLIQKWPDYLAGVMGNGQPNSVSIQAYLSYLNLLAYYRDAAADKSQDSLFHDYVRTINLVWEKEKRIPMMLKEVEGVPVGLTNDSLYRGKSILKFVPETMEQLLFIYEQTGDEACRKLFHTLQDRIENTVQSMPPNSDLPFFDDVATQHVDSATTIHAAYVVAKGNRIFPNRTSALLESQLRGTLFRNLLTSERDIPCLKGVCVPGSPSEGLHDNLASVLGDYQLIRYLCEKAFA